MTQKPPAGIPATWKIPDGKILSFRCYWQHPDCIAVRYDDRGEKKVVIPFVADGNAGYKSTAPPEPYALFGLETLRDPGLPGFIVEGQPCAAVLHSLGLQAATSLGGARSPHKSSWTPLQAFRRIYVLPDADDAGERYAADAVHILAALPGSREILISRLPGLSEGQDVVDFLKARVPGWDGFEPLPREQGGDLAATLVETVEDCSEPPPPEWTQAAVEPAPDAWDVPVSLEAAVIPPWPGDVFPPDVQAFVDALAASTETPPELAGMMVLAVLATAAQGRYRVRIKHDYFEPVNVWTCCALPSGNRKTAVWQAAIEPLAQWEREQRDILQPQRERAESEAKTLTGRVEALRRKAAAAKKADAVPDIMREIEVVESTMPTIPTLPQVWTADVTSENLAVIMADNNECMSLLSDEGGMFDTLAGRYSNGIPNLDIYNQGHAGSAVRVNRGSRPAVFLERPALTIGICPQPDVVQALADKPGFRGRGLLARWMYAMPASNLGRRTLNAVPMRDAVRDAYRGIVRAILNHPYGTDADGNACAHVLKLSADAFTAWAGFANTIEGGMAEGGTFAHITDWASKLPGAVCRIAAVFHVARHAHGEPWDHSIGAADMAAAVRLAEALGKHALIAFDCMGADAALDDARAVLSWIRRDAVREFTRHDVHAKLRSRFQRADSIDPALAVLTERAFIRPRPVPVASAVGRPKGKTFDVNPAVGGGREKEVDV